MKHFITFGSDHLDKDGNSLGNYYLPIEGNTYEEIRAKAFAIRGDKFCTDIHWKDVAEQRQRWGIEEASLADCIITDATLDEINEMFAPEHIDDVVDPDSMFKNQCKGCNTVLVTAGDNKRCPNEECDLHVPLPEVKEPIISDDPKFGENIAILVDDTSDRHILLKTDVPPAEGSQTGQGSAATGEPADDINPTGSDKKP